MNIPTLIISKLANLKAKTSISKSNIQIVMEDDSLDKYAMAVLSKGLQSEETKAIIKNIVLEVLK